MFHSEHYSSETVVSLLAAHKFVPIQLNSEISSIASFTCGTTPSSSSLRLSEIAKLLLVIFNCFTYFSTPTLNKPTVDLNRSTNPSTTHHRRQHPLKVADADTHPKFPPTNHVSLINHPQNGVHSYVQPLVDSWVRQQVGDGRGRTFARRVRPEELYFHSLVD